MKTLLFCIIIMFQQNGAWNPIFTNYFQLYIHIWNVMINMLLAVAHHICPAFLYYTLLGITKWSYGTSKLGGLPMIDYRGFTNLSRLKLSTCFWACWWTTMVSHSIPLSCFVQYTNKVKNDVNIVYKWKMMQGHFLSPQKIRVEDRKNNILFYF